MRNKNFRQKRRDEMFKSLINRRQNKATAGPDLAYRIEYNKMSPSGLYKISTHYLQLVTMETFYTEHLNIDQTKL